MDSVHDSQLLSTIVVSLTAAFICGLVATKLRIPPIVGYLAAGVMIGPYTPGFVGNVQIAEELSEIGIVLLMFGVGLHFSMKNLMEVKGIALPGALVQIAAATGMGVLLAHVSWGWTLEAGILFGLSLSVASTVVLLRSLEEFNLLHTTNGQIAIGWLIVEDLAMVLALVLIPTLVQTTESDAGGEAVRQMLIAVAKIMAFFAVMLIGGKSFLPWLLNVVAGTRSRELFTLAVFTAAVGIAFGAAQLFGVSFALGAFFAGMMIRESDLNHEVADRALPFQDAFAVLFFVSVGMLFNPSAVLQEPLKVVAVTGIIMLGKSVAALLIVLALKYPLKTGLMVSASLAQIGEFSFILISLGVLHKLIPVESHSLVLAGAIISIALNPVAFHVSNMMLSFAGRSKKLSSIFNVSDQDLSHLRRGENKALRDNVILVGYGQTGARIAQSILDLHVDLVIIESNREKVDTLRSGGRHAIAGDATHPETLQAAAIEKAIAVIITLPNPFEARRVLETALTLNPKIKILVHAHNETEAGFYEKQHVHLAVTGQREVARRIASFIHEMQNK